MIVQFEPRNVSTISGVASSEQNSSSERLKENCAAKLVMISATDFNTSSIDELRIVSFTGENIVI